MFRWLHWHVKFSVACENVSADLEMALEMPDGVINTMVFKRTLSKYLTPYHMLRRSDVLFRML